jgi:hypothetical protein
MIERFPPMPDAQRRIAVYKQGYHMLLRDLHAEVPVNDIAFWALNRNSTAALPSGAEHRPAPEGRPVPESRDVGAANK